MKIFQIGFNRCGTRSIYSYLSANGLKSAHWENGRIARRMFVNLAEGRPLMAGMDHVDVFTDMELLTWDVFLEGYKLFPVLAQQYADAVFILNTRDREDWIRSRLQHADGYYLRRFKSYLNTPSNEHVVAYWRADWDRHHARVSRFFDGRPHRFFVCPIDAELPHRLKEALPELNLDPSLYETVGAAGSERRAPVAESAGGGITSG